MATLTETMSVFRMPSRYICNAFFRARLFLVQIKNDFAKIQNDARLNLKCFVSFSNASSRVENAFSDLGMRFQRFRECLLLELEMPPAILRMLIEELKMIFEELKMLLAL